MHTQLADQPRGHFCVRICGCAANWACSISKTARPLAIPTAAQPITCGEFTHTAAPATRLAGPARRRAEARAISGCDIWASPVAVEVRPGCVPLRPVQGAVSDPASRLVPSAPGIRSTEPGMSARSPFPWVCRGPLFAVGWR
jgi:hypothetical protein